MPIMKVKKGTKSISKKKQKRHTFEKKMSTCGKQKNNDVNYCNKCIKCLFRISTEKSEKKNKHINCSSSCCYIEVISTTDNISTQVINEFDFTFNPEFDVTTDYGDKTPAFPHSGLHLMTITYQSIMTPTKKSVYHLHNQILLALTS